MARGQGNGLNATGHPSVSYEHGEFQWALRLLYERTGDKQYYDYMQKSVDNLVAPDGTIRNYKYVAISVSSDLFLLSSL